MISIKIRRITWPRQAIQQKFAASENICVWTYEKRPQVIRLDLESSTFIQLFIRLFIRLDIWLLVE